MYSIEEVRRLSQEEGLNDREIGETLGGIPRVTITRIRERNNIPRCNKDNKMDKSYVCLNCKSTIYIRRKDRRQAFCPVCQKLINN